MNELALFAGAGGGLLASDYAGWNTRCAVELDWYCRCVLTRRQNDNDLRSIFPIWDDIRTFDGRPWSGLIDVITGGFPCQAYSSAASGKNTADDLWPEMLRVVADVAPKYVYAENVSPKAINAASDDLKQLGYKTRMVKLSAADVGADHRRSRCWLLAYTDDPRKLLRGFNAETSELQTMAKSFWRSKPASPRIPHGMAYRMERIRSTGNGQVPICWLTALKILCEKD